ncbi:MAG: protein-L-isoaspartate(D-aspartate) O-methyltransferase [Thiotrichales bacterium]
MNGNRPDIDGIGMTSQRTRDRMVQRLQAEGIAEPRVLEALRKVPRHLFVDEALASRAYEDVALPIDSGQTISQPFIVARMTELVLQTEPAPRKVLEIGTGSGYQAAVLAQLVPEVYSVERLRHLYEQARERLRGIGYGNVRLKHADGILGWRNEAPFDAIVVTAAASQVPETLLEQLRIGGRLIAPVGAVDGVQSLRVLTRTEHGYDDEALLPVVFVPLLPGREERR